MFEKYEPNEKKYYQQNRFHFTIVSANLIQIDSLDTEFWKRCTFDFI